MLAVVKQTFFCQKWILDGAERVDKVWPKAIF